MRLDVSLCLASVPPSARQPNDDVFQDLPGCLKSYPLTGTGTSPKNLLSRMLMMSTSSVFREELKMAASHSQHH